VVKVIKDQNPGRRPQSFETQDKDIVAYNEIFKHVAQRK